MGADHVGIVIPHLGTQPDDAFLEQTVVDVVLAGRRINRRHTGSSGRCGHGALPSFRWTSHATTAPGGTRPALVLDRDYCPTAPPGPS
ncbi:hypothetical protein ACFFX0_02210 [Citricoccus parietis]|uniref:Uncharacterized protein n=1 Tax=Citricoccus parietis TaxID=592307 RepID=A0ABV5FTS1_9MICC